MHTDWIKAYVAVAEKGGFLQAARALGRAQSRISEQVAKLEADLGVVLIDRAIRPVRLTVAGEVFLGRAYDVLNTLDSARAEATALSGSTYGTVRLACMSSVTGDFVPRLIDRFSRVEHNIEVQVLEGPTDTLPHMLHRREADLAIAPLAYVRNDPELQWIELWDEPLKLLIHPTHRLVDSTTASLTDLDGETVVTPGCGDGARGLSPEVAALLTAAGVRVGGARRVASPHTLVAMVRSGLGVGVLSELAVRLAGAEGVELREFTEPEAVRRTVLTWPRDRKSNTAAQRLTQFIAAHRPPTGTTRVGATS
ncbi:LysR family transcriptional regulator [Mycobacterium sp. PS03-16]|uniref:LysR family transcriptional regulator n=1 Tax=Mycobacterium sp. PS03-16 TaxID=2559611 RepID=UPI001073CB5D|nr:LysR family transcriptional regulator [Mycobacterium sp. PS03-16]TFV57892.1 LysR family transcriptional regulator [Mycobacterium sp. PS03-16]